MSHAQQKKSVLLIDGEENYCYLLAKILRRAGAEVLATSNTDKASELLSKQQNLDFLICDASLQRREWQKLTEVINKFAPEKLIFLGEEKNLYGKEADIADSLPWVIFKRSAALDRLKDLVASNGRES